ncbi:MAG: hypothetical protein HQM08_14095 [Candidatus Riflebacteria bacterium]|nr:hypothetical protein [Candidatus Riflebacteria bacterium]
MREQSILSPHARPDTDVSTQGDGSLSGVVPLNQVLIGRILVVGSRDHVNFYELQDSFHFLPVGSGRLAHIATEDHQRPELETVGIDNVARLFASMPDGSLDNTTRHEVQQAPMDDRISVRVWRFSTKRAHDEKC